MFCVLSPEYIPLPANLHKIQPKLKKSINKISSHFSRNYIDESSTRNRIFRVSGTKLNKAFSSLSHIFLAWYLILFQVSQHQLPTPKNHQTYQKFLQKKKKKSETQMSRTYCHAFVNGEFQFPSAKFVVRIHTWKP